MVRLDADEVWIPTRTLQAEVVSGSLGLLSDTMQSDVVRNNDLSGFPLMNGANIRVLSGHVDVEVMDERVRLGP